MTYAEPFYIEVGRGSFGAQNLLAIYRVMETGARILAGIAERQPLDFQYRPARDSATILATIDDTMDNKANPPLQRLRGSWAQSEDKILFIPG